MVFCTGLFLGLTPSLKAPEADCCVLKDPLAIISSMTEISLAEYSVADSIVPALPPESAMGLKFCFA